MVFRWQVRPHVQPRGQAWRHLIIHEVRSLSVSLVRVPSTYNNSWIYCHLQAPTHNTLYPVCAFGKTLKPLLPKLIYTREGFLCIEVYLNLVFCLNRSVPNFKRLPALTLRHMKYCSSCLPYCANIYTFEGKEKKNKE